MAAVVTKKPGGDNAVQMTFPTVFEYTYAAEGLPLLFGGALTRSQSRAVEQARQMQMMEQNVAQIPAASIDDLQEAYHEQKRIDATRMANAKVASTRTSERLMLTGHQNYHLPKPVLTQRRFANPSNGAGGLGGDLYSARNDRLTSLYGGVLRTKEAQQWGRNQLQNRVAQLDAIDQASAEFQMSNVAELSEAPIAVEQGLPSAKVNLFVEFNLLRQALLDALLSGAIDRFTLTDYARMLAILFRLAPSANREELEDMKEGADSMASLMQGVRDQAAEGYDAERRGIISAPKYLSGIETLVDKTSKYVNEMLRNVSLSPKERVALSRNLVRDLGFGKQLTALEDKVYQTALRDARGERKTDDNVDDDDDGGDHFTPESQTVEDTARREQVANTSVYNMSGQFSKSTQDTFAKRSGAYGDKPYSAEDLPSSSAQNTGRRGNIEKARMPVLAPSVPEPAFADIGQRRRVAPAATATQVVADGEGGEYEVESPPRASAAAAAAAPAPMPAATPAPEAKTSRAVRAALEGRTSEARSIYTNPSTTRPQKVAIMSAIIRTRNATKDEMKGLLNLSFISPKIYEDAQIEAGAPVTRRVLVPKSGRGKMTPALFAKQRLGKGRSGGAKGKGKMMGHGLTRAMLPKTREGFIELADELRGKGFPIRINSGSTLASIKANFFKKFAL
jgi:hypothetical protein